MKIRLRATIYANINLIEPLRDTRYWTLKKIQILINNLIIFK